MQDNKIKQIVYKTLLHDLNITKKYNIYNNPNYIVAEMKEVENYAIILYCTNNKLLKNDIHNSEPYTYYAIYINNSIYIISRDCISASYYSGDFIYSFDDYITITEEYLNREGKAVRKLQAVI